MKLKATIIQILPAVSGESPNGKWTRQEIIVETQANFPKKVCLTLWGDKLDRSKVTTGRLLEFSIDPESRENKGRWYTTLKVWKIEDPLAPDVPFGTTNDILSGEPGLDLDPQEDDPLPF
jgi:hypothetical protein